VSFNAAIHIADRRLITLAASKMDLIGRSVTPCEGAEDTNPLDWKKSKVY